MEELKRQLEQIETELRTEQQRGALADGVKIASLQEQQQAVQAQINQVQQEQRAQEQGQHLDSLAQQIQDMDVFGSLFPDEEYQTVLGLGIIDEKRQALNKILHAWAVMIQTQLIDKHNAEIGALNAELSGVTTERDSLKLQLIDAQKWEATYNQIKTEYDDLEQKYDAIKAQQAQKDADIASLQEQLRLKQDHVDDLRNQIANAPAPRPALDVTPQTSQSLSDLLNVTRNNSIKSAKDLALAGETFRGKIIVGADGSPLTPPPLAGGSESTDSFRSEDTQGHAADSGVPITKTVEAVTDGGTFQSEQAATNGLDRDAAIPESDGTSVTRDEFNDLAQRVANLEAQKVNDGAAA